MRRRLGLAILVTAGFFGCGGGSPNLENARFELQQKNYLNAVKLLERAQKQYPGNREVDSLLTIARKGNP
jgi:hypothetical protein